MKNRKRCRLLIVFAALTTFLAFGAPAGAAPPDPPETRSVRLGDPSSFPPSPGRPPAAPPNTRSRSARRATPTSYLGAPRRSTYADSHDADKFPNRALLAGARKTAAARPGPGAARSTSPDHPRARPGQPRRRWQQRDHPLLEWQHVQGATYYKVELSTSSTFIVMEATYTTYNTRLTPSHAGTRHTTGR